MDNKMVSIVIPAYNASNYLAEAIDSALAQTYTNIEIIVVNDGSPDDGATKRVAQSYGNKIRYFEKSNGGCASALNYGIQQMNGFWFSWLSHDDLYLPEKIETLIALVDRYNLDSEATVLGCNDLIMGPSGKTSGNLFNNSTGVLSPVQAFGETLNKKTFNGCGLLIPKKILDKVGDFRTDYKHLLDRELWMRIAVNGHSYCFADEAMVISRVHNQQVTVKAQDILYQEEERLIKEYSNLIASKDDFLKQLCYFAVKRQHPKLAKLIEQQLKQLDRFDIKTRMSIFRWNVEGRLKKIVRNTYKNLLRKK
jgi:glycosyltransferase involved in cell wall biosynthesis